MHRHLHDNQQYMGNITVIPVTYSGMFDVGTQEYAGMGYRVDDGQTTWTDESQMMTSHQSRTSQSHKRITQMNHTKQDDIMSRCVWRI